MFVSNLSSGFGQSSQVPSLLSIIQAIQIRGMHTTSAGFAGHFGAAIIGDYSAFVAGGPSATFKSADNSTYCNKDNANRAQCWLNRAGDAGKAPIRDLQQAVDRFTNLVTQRLQGRELRGPVPQENGTQPVMSYRITNVQSPIASEAGYDGIVGPATKGAIAYAMTVAGILKRADSVAVMNVWAHPTRNDLMAQYSEEVADFLNDASNNFDKLIAEYEERGRVPAQTPIDNPDTLPYVVPLAAKSRNTTAAIIATAATMVGLTTLASVSAARHKPAKLYALGRRRRSRR